LRDSFHRLAIALSLALRAAAIAFLVVVALHAPWHDALAVLGAPMVLAGALPFTLLLLLPAALGLPAGVTAGVAACVLLLAVVLRVTGHILPPPDSAHGKFIRRHPDPFRWLARAALLAAAAAVLHRDAPLAVALIWLGALAVFENGLPRPVRTGTWRERMASWALFLVSVTLGLALAEAAARVVLPENIRGRAHFYDYHPESSFLLRPGTSSYHAIRVGENEYRRMHVSISSEGFRDRELGPKQDGEFRVLLLGDSFAMGWGLDAPDMPSAQLERILAERWPEGRVTVVNAGMGNSGPWQHRILLREHGFALEPDLVIHQLYTGNDIENTLWRRRLHLAPDDTGGGRAAFAQWNRRGRPSVRVERWLTANVALYHLWLRAAGHHDWATRLIDSLRPFSAAADDGRFWSPACPPLAHRTINIEPCLAEWPPIVHEGWAMFKEDVHAVRADCHERGVDYVAYANPGPETILANVWNIFVQQADPRVEYTRYRDCEEAERFFAEEGIPFVPMLDAFRDHPDPNSLFIPYDGHPTVEGARLAAEQLAGYLIARFGAAPPPV
jgi:hypothetical protein